MAFLLLLDALDFGGVGLSWAVKWNGHQFMIKHDASWNGIWETFRPRRKERIRKVIQSILPSLLSIREAHTFRDESAADDFNGVL